MRFRHLYLIIWLREKLTFVFIKKVITCCLKKLFSAKKIDVWQNNFYGNANRKCLADYLCSRLFEENYYDETVFDDFWRQCLCYALKAVSYLPYNLFLDEKRN